MGPEPEAVLASPLDHVDDPDPAIRRLAVSLCAGAAGEPGVARRLLGLLAGDVDGGVRAEAAEVLGAVRSPETAEGLVGALADDDSRVVEAAVTALGEMPPSPEIVDRLLGLAAGDDADKLVREAAVASLGALGDERAVPVLVDLVATGPPQVRRRAVVALTVFDHPDVEPALRRAAADRNPMVREVAEMVVGRGPA